MVFDSANLQRRTINVCERTGEVRIQFRQISGREDAFTISCAKH